MAKIIVELFLSGAQSAHQMGVNFESMSLVFTTDNGLGDFLSCSSFIVFSEYFFIGCAIISSDGSSPRGYSRVLVVNHRLEFSSYSSLFCRILS
jgi:hypothetical protein